MRLRRRHFFSAAACPMIFRWNKPGW